MTWLSNFIRTKIANWLALLIVPALAAACTWLVDATKGGPFAELVHYLQLDNPVTLMFAFACFWLWLWHHCSQLRSWKYAGAMQYIVNVIGAKYGIQIEDDGVIGPQTVAGVQEVTKALIQSQGEPLASQPQQTQAALHTTLATQASVYPDQPPIPPAPRVILGVNKR